MYTQFCIQCGARTVSAAFLLLSILSASSLIAQAPPALISQGSAPTLVSTSAPSARHDAVFVENKGQWDARARFLLQTDGVDTWITDGGVTFDLYRHHSRKNDRVASPMSMDLASDRTAALEKRRTGHIVRIAFEGTTSGIARATDQLPGYHNYYVGKNPSRWATHVRRFSDVRIESLYSGVEARFYVDRGRPRYDLIVAPGADPSPVRMRVDGASSVNVTSDGVLRIATSMGPLEQRELLAYQEVDGRRQKVRCAFRTAADGTVGFAIGNYDRTRPLIIDPIVYSTYLGGNARDGGCAVAVCSDGDVLLTGWTVSTGFPTTTGAYQTTSGGASDVFVTRLNEGSLSLVYSTFVGGSGGDEGIDLVLDGGGNTWFSGLSNGADYPTTSGVAQETLAGSYDAIATKLDPDGQLLLSTYIGGSGLDQSHVLTVTPSGDVVIAGQTTSSNYPTTDDAFSEAYSGGTDAMLTVLDGSDATMIYSSYYGGALGGEAFRGVTVDSEGDIYLVGGSTSSDLPTTTGAYQTTFAGVGDAHVLKIDGSTFGTVYWTYIGGSAREIGYGIGVDAGGVAHVVAQTASSNMPVSTGAYDASFSGGIDVYVGAISAEGSSLEYGTYLGGTRADYPWGLAIDHAANVFVVGYTYSSDFPRTENLESAVTAALADVFVARLDAGGENLGYSTYFGGTANDFGFGLRLDGCGDAYIFGRTGSSDLPTSSGAFDRTANGLEDAFLTRLTVGEDVTPPVITVTLDPELLWPPNHGMEDIEADVSVEDNCGDVDYALTSITSDEDDNGLGDGDRADDIQAETLGTDDLAFRLRAERSGTGNGRVYTITYTATDENGNTADGIAHVLVPHSQNQLKPVTFTLPHLGFASRVVPNPVRDRGMIEFHLAAASLVAVRVYNELGAVVSMPLNAELNAGAQFLNWNAVDATGMPLAPGSYTYVITADGTTESGRLVVVN